MHTSRRIAPVAGCLLVVSNLLAATPASGDERDAGGFVGVLFAPSTVDLAATTEGTIRSIEVRMGDVVSPGALIATLDDTRLRQDLAAAEAEARAARSEFKRAEAELAIATDRRERRDRAFEDKGQTAIVSEEEVLTAREQEKSALAGLERALAGVDEHDARVRRLQQQLDRMVIKAPFDGTIAARYLDSGSTVRPGTPIARLISSGGLWVRFAVDPETASSLVPGRRLEVRVPELTDALHGSVRQVAPEVDPASGLVFAEAVLETDGGRETPSMAGRAVRVFLPLDDRR